MKTPTQMVAGGAEKAYGEEYYEGEQRGGESFTVLSEHGSDPSIHSKLRQ